GPKKKCFHRRCDHHHNQQCESYEILKAEKIVIEYDTSPKLSDVTENREPRRSSDAIDSLGEDSTLITQDFAMKFLPAQYRKTQAEFFGKRGISWHLTVCQSNNGGEIVAQTFVHIIESGVQDSNTVVSVMEHVLQTLKCENRTLNRVVYRQDNAGCYHSATTILACKILRERSSLDLHRIDFCDPQRGRGGESMAIPSQRLLNLKKLLNSTEGLNGCVSGWSFKAYDENYYSVLDNNILNYLFVYLNAALTGTTECKYFHLVSSNGSCSTNEQQPAIDERQVEDGCIKSYMTHGRLQQHLMAKISYADQGWACRDPKRTGHRFSAKHGTFLENKFNDGNRMTKLKNSRGTKLRQKPMPNDTRRNRQPENHPTAFHDQSFWHQRVLIVILRSLQQNHYAPKIKVLQNLLGNKSRFEDRKDARERNRQVKRTSTLYRLDPFIDLVGLLRVGGRIRRASLPYDVKHPVIIPKSSHITELIIRHFHEKIVHHQGRGITVNAIRQAGCWITNGRSVVARYISKWVTCRKLRRANLTQKMSDLPEERLEPAAPFTYTGMDVFGPWLIKDGRKTETIRLNLYLSMFSCSSSRDTQFYGNRLIYQRIETIYQPTRKSGIWEGLIRTVRSVLADLLQELATQLDDESLRTLFTEAENIINSRPLVVEELSTAECPAPLTPNQLLIMKCTVVLYPPGNFERHDLYSRKRWRRVQYLAKQFWIRWRREYCALRYERKKWNTLKRNSQVGDVVVLHDEDLQRNKWPLARIVRVLPSKDGLLRKVQLQITRNGKRVKLERPIQKLTLIVEKDEDREESPPREQEE
ncbi:Hypothetical predicted protein, partial [Paramuricea clavata]